MAADEAMVAPSLAYDNWLRFLTAHREGRGVDLPVCFVDHSAGGGSFGLGAAPPSAQRRGLWHQLAVAPIRITPDLRVIGVVSDLSWPDAEWPGRVPVQHFPPWVR